MIKISIKYYYEGDYKKILYIYLADFLPQSYIIHINWIYQ